VHSIIRDDHGRLVPLVRPKLWQAHAVRRSRERTELIARAREHRKSWLARMRWMDALDRHGIAELEASGIEWATVERWLNTLYPREAYVARMVVKQVLQTLSDEEARPAERLEARRELYRRLIAAGIVD
jgi:hypothetical protein